MAEDPGDGELMHAHETDAEMSERAARETHTRRSCCSQHLHVRDVQTRTGEGGQKAHTCAQQVCLTPVTQGRRAEQRGRKKRKSRVKQGKRREFRLV